jgi:hypothetical protein
MDIKDNLSKEKTSASNIHTAAVTIYCCIFLD